MRNDGNKYNVFYSPKLVLGNKMRHHYDNTFAALYVKYEKLRLNLHNFCGRNSSYERTVC